jgi:cytoskeletal protein RodZ
MKIVRFLLVMIIVVVWLPGTSLAHRADHPSQQAASQSGDKSNSGYQGDVGVREENDPTRSEEADRDSKRSADVTTTTTKHRSSLSHPQPAVSHPRRPFKTPATNYARIDTPRTVIGPQETSLKTAAVPNQAISHRSLSAPSSAVSVNCQQFKNSRDPGAHLAFSGGPPAAARGTAAINGTNMKRKR